ncbi:hypothetical protein PFISCL1PPCAC_9782, partial [Pristionchus fissidentatus]
SIFLLLLCTQITTSFLMLDGSLVYDIRQELLQSKGKFIRHKNSTHDILHLKSLNTSIRVRDVSYNFGPQPLCFAWIAYPDSVDLTQHNTTCLNNWRSTYNEKVNKCYTAADAAYNTPLCEYRRDDADNCEVNKPLFTCVDYISVLRYVEEDLIFPDGRTFVDIAQRTRTL